MMLYTGISRRESRAHGTCTSSGRTTFNISRTSTSPRGESMCKMQDLGGSTPIPTRGRNPNHGLSILQGGLYTTAEKLMGRQQTLFRHGHCCRCQDERSKQDSHLSQSYNTFPFAMKLLVVLKKYGIWRDHFQALQRFVSRKSEWMRLPFWASKHAEHVCAPRGLASAGEG